MQAADRFHAPYTTSSQSYSSSHKDNTGDEKRQTESDRCSRKNSSTYLNIYLAESIPPIVTDEQQTRFGDPNHAHCIQTQIYVQRIVLYRVTPVFS